MGMDSNKNSPRTADQPDEIGALPFWLRAGIIILAALWIYSPAMRGDWLWDDDWYITNQPLMRDLSGLFKFWFEPGSWVEYYPLEETVLWIEWHLFGSDTLGYHLVTLALHIGNALLVWRLLDKFGLRKAWIGGLIFAVHPAMVESAAWIAETKNTLSTFPCLLAACVWIDYDNRRQPRDYAFAILYFTAALLCKIAVAPLPLALLLYAWWKRRHIGRSDLAALVPFVIIAVVVCGISLAGSQMYTKIEPKTWPLPVLTFPEKLALSGQTLGVYVAHVFWPVDLLPNYPQWPVSASSLLVYLPWLVLFAVLLLLWLQRKSWGGTALLGVGFFLVFLLPFLGFVMASYMSFTWVMDHFLYVPMIGLIGLFVAALDSIDTRVSAPARVGVTAATTILVTLLAFESHAYSAVFASQKALWSYTAERNPGDWLAHYILGRTMLANNEPQEALEQYQLFLQLGPDKAMGHLNLGRALQAANRMPESLAQYDTAIALTPSDSEIYNQKGMALMQAGRTAEAQAQFEQALKLRPRYVDALENLGIALASGGHFDKSADLFRAALAIRPGAVSVHINLGIALRQLGREPEAEDEFRQALKLDPGNARAQAALAQSPLPH